MDKCQERYCRGLDKFHVMKDGDCRDCKRAGNRVTRGREGKGRYAQEPKARFTAPAAKRTPLMPIHTNVKNGPWAKDYDTRRDKRNERRSPIREKADEAWLEEHEKRMRDLKARSQPKVYKPVPSHPVRPSSYYQQEARYQAEAAHFRDEMRKIQDVERARTKRKPEDTDGYDNYHSQKPRIPPRGRSFDSGFETRASSKGRHRPPPPHRPVEGLRERNRRWQTW